MTDPTSPPLHDPPPTPPVAVSAAPYVLAAVATIVAYLGAGVGFTLAGNDTLAGIVIALIIPSVTTIFALRNTAEAKVQASATHLSVNSRMSELLALAKKAALAEGNLQGRAEQTAEARDEPGGPPVRFDEPPPASKEA